MPPSTGSTGRFGRARLANVMASPSSLRLTTVVMISLSVGSGGSPRYQLEHDVDRKYSGVIRFSGQILTSKFTRKSRPDHQPGRLSGQGRSQVRMHRPGCSRMSSGILWQIRAPVKQQCPSCSRTGYRQHEHGSPASSTIAGSSWGRWRSHRMIPRSRERRRYATRCLPAAGS